MKTTVMFVFLAFTVHLLLSWLENADVSMVWKVSGAVVYMVGYFTVIKKIITK